MLCFVVLPLMLFFCSVLPLRTRGAFTIEDSLLHNDPEALRRRLRQAKGGGRAPTPPCAAAAAEGAAAAAAGDGQGEAAGADCEQAGLCGKENEEGCARELASSRAAAVGGGTLGTEQQQQQQNGQVRGEGEEAAEHDATAAGENGEVALTAVGGGERGKVVGVRAMEWEGGGVGVNGEGVVAATEAGDADMMEVQEGIEDGVQDPAVAAGGGGAAVGPSGVGAVAAGGVAYGSGSSQHSSPLALAPVTNGQMPRRHHHYDQQQQQSRQPGEKLHAAAVAAAVAAAGGTPGQGTRLDPAAAIGRCAPPGMVGEQEPQQQGVGQRAGTSAAAGGGGGVGEGWGGAAGCSSGNGDQLVGAVAGAAADGDKIGQGAGHEGMRAAEVERRVVVRAADPGDLDRAEVLLGRMVEASEGLVVSQLEGVHAKCSRLVVRAGGEVDRGRVLGMLEGVVTDLEQQREQQ